MNLGGIQARGGAPGPGSVTNAMLADMAAHTFKVRKTNSTGAPEDASISEVLTLLGLTAPLTFIGNVDCSGNPNYPAALKAGDVYRVSVAGKIGGASGVVVSVGDMIYSTAANAGGTQAAVGANWEVEEGNIAGITAAGLSMLTAASAVAQLALLTGGPLAGITALGIRDTSAAFDVQLKATSSSALTADRALTLDVGNAANTLKLGGGTNTFAGLLTITQGSANAGILASTGYSLTGSDTTSAITLAGTLNTSGSPTVIDYTLTLTAYGTDTRFMRLRDSGGIERFAVGINSTFSMLTLSNDLYYGPVLLGSSGMFFIGRHDNLPYTSSSGTYACFGNDGVEHGFGLPSAGVLSWGSSNPVVRGDIRLRRISAGILAMKDDATQQKFRVYDSGGTKYIENSHNGTNATLLWSSGNLIMTTLPNSDPGVSGALYTTAGAVMQSP